MTGSLPDGLIDLIAPYLGRQRWYAGDPPEPGSVQVERARELWVAEGDGPQLWQAIVAIADVHYQLLIGSRPVVDRADFLHGREDAVLAPLDANVFYDATLDSELARILLEVASDGAQTATFARPITAEQSNTSLVFDDRLVLKIFRRLHPGRNPDVEVTAALAAAGFEHVAAPLLAWRDDPYDLAFGQQYLAGGSEGWALALTSLRDLYNSTAAHPADTGGDFAAESGRLGRMTAEMHLALAEAFGSVRSPEVVAAWRDLVEGLVTRLGAATEVAGRDLMATAAPLLARLRAVDDPGPAIRVHGDYHLGQVMQTDAGWYVLDFEGEPSKPLGERTARCSPLKDISSMLRSFDYAARYALTERLADEQAQLEPMAGAWEAHNRQAFLEGYRDVKGIGALLAGPESNPAVMIAYELDKALYELDYERAHRPEWVPLPLGAIQRLVDGGS
ncbi:MAG TPA: phosphotransferase [Acidimicrobiales bacterium]